MSSAHNIHTTDLLYESMPKEVVNILPREVLTGSVSRLGHYDLNDYFEAEKQKHRFEY
jgi:hypothetical protein